MILESYLVTFINSKDTTFKNTIFKFHALNMKYYDNVQEIDG